MKRDYLKPVDGVCDGARGSSRSRTRGTSTVGTVTLVGSGPGDPDLLTLKAIRALQSADIVLFDHLVSDEILDLARSEAKRMLVGKRARQPSCRQQDINTLMIKLARQGKSVVRLKSGDPMVFGRAGEEIAELRAHAIPVKVVPGVTAASAMAATLHVSLTHRDHAHSVRYVTGHSREGRLPEDLDWTGLADPETTLVFYMGGKTAPNIAQRLIEEGLSPTTPVVVMANVSRADETLWQGRLVDLLHPNHAHFDNMFPKGAPVLIGIGAALKEASHQNQTLLHDVFQHACDVAHG